jgi:hypothetical protein
MLDIAEPVPESRAIDGTALIVCSEAAQRCCYEGTWCSERCSAGFCFRARL